MEVAPQLKESLNKNFFDFLLTFKQVSRWYFFYLPNHIKILLKPTTICKYFLRIFQVLICRFKDVPVSRCGIGNVTCALVNFNYSI